MLYFSYQFEYGLNTVFSAISYYVWTNNLLLFVLHVYNQSSLVSSYNAPWHVMTDLFAYPRFTCGFWGGGKYSYVVLVIFYVATFFPWYPHLLIRYLNMSYSMMICNFANVTCHGRGALGCFDILIGKSTVLITVQY